MARESKALVIVLYGKSEWEKSPVRSGLIKGTTTENGSQLRSLGCTRKATRGSDLSPMERSIYHLLHVWLRCHRTGFMLSPSQRNQKKVNPLPVTTGPLLQNQYRSIVASLLIHVKICMTMVGGPFPSTQQWFVVPISKHRSCQASCLSCPLLT